MLGQFDLLSFLAFLKKNESLIKLSSNSIKIIMCLYIDNNDDDVFNDHPLWIQATNDIYIGLRSGYKNLQNRKVPFNMKGYNSWTI